MRVRATEEKPTATLEQSASHGDVVMTEIEQQHLEAIESVGAREEIEFDQFTYETRDFILRLQIDLIFAFDVILEIGA